MDREKEEKRDQPTQCEKKIWKDEKKNSTHRPASKRTRELRSAEERKHAILGYLMAAKGKGTPA